MDTSGAAALLALLNKPQVRFGDLSISVLSVIVAIVGLVILYLFARYSERASQSFLEKKKLEASNASSIAKLVRYFVSAVGLLMVLDLAGVSLSSLAAIGAVFMVGISFGLQNITQNLISGLILLVEQPFRKGDLIKVGSYSGKVIDTSTRYTQIETADNHSVILPNSMFITQPFVNLCFNGKKIRLHVQISVSYNSNMEQVMEQMAKTCSEHPLVLNDPAPKAILQDFGDSGLGIDLRFWIADVFDQVAVLSEVKLAILEAFKENNVEIPFPQMEVRIHK